MKKKFFLVMLVLPVFPVMSGRDFKISSPDGNITVTVSAGKQLSWTMTYKGIEILNSPRTANLLG